ncbi:ATP-binding cassette domain-containing protein [Luteimonas sp. FCS-9]|uniref:ATP-binding cassette domain-containing protein n=1 Tax=Luteimonas sp. FCS-9 TaxID=1547516 RepID=UPI00063E7134|nr:ATP-binding cassette domain-containing protein [Luteimonas sp. FCS-9]KLJ00767.1 methionine ABC transporter ATP-binding protein [Luteimonas sp. FCS-9]
MSDADAIALEHVAFGWTPDRAVLDIDRLRIARGERIFLHGRSGSGKSTLLALVAGIVAPVSGRVQVLGNALEAMRSSRRDALRAAQIGIVFQMFNLMPFLSVRDNVLMGCRLSSARRARAAADRPLDEEADRLLERLGLDPAALGPVPASALSVGQQQRVAAARALIGRPALVVADEPTSALDDDSAAAFMALLMAEVRRSGATLLLASHDRRLARHFDREIDLARINRVSGIPA